MIYDGRNSIWRLNKKGKAALDQAQKEIFALGGMLQNNTARTATV